MRPQYRERIDKETFFARIFRVRNRENTRTTDRPSLCLSTRGPRHRMLPRASYSLYTWVKLRPSTGKAVYFFTRPSRYISENFPRQPLSACWTSTIFLRRYDLYIGRRAFRARLANRTPINSAIASLARTGARQKMSTGVQN